MAIYLAICSEGESITLQNDLHILEIWEKRWDMSFNTSKCQVLHITRAKRPIQTRYILHGTVLESVPSAKYLGVTISDNLFWTPPPHVDSVSKKANQTLGFLKRNTKVNNKDFKSTAYTTCAATVGICFNSVVPVYSNIYYKTWSCTAQVSPLGYPWLPAHL